MATVSHLCLCTFVAMERQWLIDNIVMNNEKQFKQVVVYETGDNDIFLFAFVG